MVSNAREDLPDPLKPVITTSRSRGISSVMFLRLCSRAPPTLMNSFPITSGVVKVAHSQRTAKRSPIRLVELIALTQMVCYVSVMSKSELLRQLATLSREDLDDV